MKVLHVIPKISRAGGGPARSVQGLVAGLRKGGVDASLLALAHGDIPWIEGVESFFDALPFEDVLLNIKPDIVHLHEIWNPGLHRCAVICRRWHVPYVVSPRGMLEPWSLRQKWLKKRIARWLYQDRDLKCAAALHATAESEAAQFRKLGFKNPIIVSPNGVNVPNGFQFPVPRSPFPSASRRVLFMSRMHPKKGVLELVEAWGKLVKNELENRVGVGGWCCELVYTVNGEFEKEYEAKVKAMVKELGLEDSFIFTGALNDDEKWAAYARADLFVLPTHSENFGIVIAEALWSHVPVITTKGAPWRELEEQKCGWWINIGIDPLLKALGGAMSLPDAQRREMGANGRELVEAKYAWNAVVKPLIKAYGEISHEICH